MPAPQRSSDRSPPVTYRLYIRLHRRAVISPGRLGRCVLARGWYVYTGSARRNMAARLRRHLAADVRRHWHIDWLLARPEAEVAQIRLDRERECTVNARLEGHVVIRGFGASDCRHGCGSHLLWLGRRRPADVPRAPHQRRTFALVEALEVGRAPA